MTQTQKWRPGSFTKNFSWGKDTDGLVRLYDYIRLGFDGVMEDVPRKEFRRRVKSAKLPDFIAVNFFLFNKVINNVDYIIADELVFQALTAEHTSRFDKLALFTFNFSYAGKWLSAKNYQRRPALWAHHYIKDRVAAQFSWDTSSINSGDIENFISTHPLYEAETTRKLATNLNYLYSIGGLSEFADYRVDRWWVDALFLALDRLIEDRTLDGILTSEEEYYPLLSKSEFAIISGNTSIEKNLATWHLVDLYKVCGARERFTEKNVKERTVFYIPDLKWLLANDNRPQGAIHPTNPRILKTIPRACAMLARYAGFDVIEADELADFSIEEFVRAHTRRALERLHEQGIRPNLTAEELMKVTRDE